MERAFVCRSFVDLLHESGYHTIHVGKAHWGALGTPGERPEHFGFDVNIAGHAAGGLATYLSEQNYGHDRDGRPTSLMATPDLEHYWVDSSVRFRPLFFPHHEYYLLKCHIFDTVKIGGFQQLC